MLNLLEPTRLQPELVKKLRQRLEYLQTGRASETYESGDPDLYYDELLEIACKLYKHQLYLDNIVRKFIEEVEVKTVDK